MGVLILDEEIPKMPRFIALKTGVHPFEWRVWDQHCRAIVAYAATESVAQQAAAEANAAVPPTRWGRFKLWFKRERHNPTQSEIPEPVVNEFEWQRKIARMNARCQAAGRPVTGGKQ